MSHSRTGCHQTDRDRTLVRSRVVVGLIWLIVSGLPAVAVAQTLTLAEVLFRASEAAVRLEREFGNQMADEAYEQRVVSFDGEVKRTRQLSSNVLFFRAPAADTWTTFRNVLEVDGKFKGREWLDTSKTAPTLAEFLEAAARRDRAGARHYLGEAPRMLHMPLLALTFLHPLNRYRSNFEKVGEDTWEGRPVWVIRFSEHRLPPFVRVDKPRPAPSSRGRGRRSGTSSGDLFASGTFWVDSERGDVVRSDLIVGGSVTTVQARTHVTVTFTRLGDTDIPIPVEMHESYDNPLFPEADRLEGVARYSGFRPLSLESGDIALNRR